MHTWSTLPLRSACGWPSLNQKNTNAAQLLSCHVSLRDFADSANMASSRTGERHELRDPFDRWSPETMGKEIATFLQLTGLDLYKDFFERGGILNLDSFAFRPGKTLSITVSEKEKDKLEIEHNTDKRLNRFKQTKGLYLLVALCSAAAAGKLSLVTTIPYQTNNLDSVQGWDESAVNGGRYTLRALHARMIVDHATAQIYYSKALSIEPHQFEYGLVNSAPYLLCTLSCLLTYPLNYRFGRRGTIFVTCLFSFASCLGQAFVQSWPQLLVARLMLGIGIGPKSATVPVYSAECAPTNVRGALVMMWQVRTARPHEPRLCSIS